MTVTVRDARLSGAEAFADAWLDAAGFYTGLEPRHFQISRADGLADLWREALAEFKG